MKEKERKKERKKVRKKERMKERKMSLYFVVSTQRTPAESFLCTNSFGSTLHSFNKTHGSKSVCVCVRERERESVCECVL